MKLVKHPFPVAPLSVHTEPRIITHEITLHSAIEASGRIIIPIPGGFQCCFPDEILYLKAESNYTEIYFKDGSKKLLSKTLKVLEEVLPAHRFFRIHKSYVVNASHISDIMLSTNDRAIKLVNGQILPVSRDNKEIFDIKIIS